MAVASRTPEGDPYECPICGQRTALLTSDAGDTLCPACGQLLWRLRHHLADRVHVPIDELNLESLSGLYEGDSLDLVELVMSLEEEFGTELLSEEAGEFRTLADVIRWLRQREA
jgi:acyl carrier protein